MIISYVEEFSCACFNTEQVKGMTHLVKLNTIISINVTVFKIHKFSS